MRVFDMEICLEKGVCLLCCFQAWHRCSCLRSKHGTVVHVVDLRQQLNSANCEFGQLALVLAADINLL